MKITSTLVAGLIATSILFGGCSQEAVTNPTEESENTPLIDVDASATIGVWNVFENATYINIIIEEDNSAMIDDGAPLAFGTWTVENDILKISFAENPEYDVNYSGFQSQGEDLYLLNETTGVKERWGAVPIN